MHRFELRFAVLTALALLFAQLGAVSHAYSHDAAAQSSSSTPAPASTAHDLCNDCLVYAPLLCAAGTPTALPCIEPPGRSLAARTTGNSFANLDLTLAFRSRAPPAAL